jgi:DNA adenine methylase
LPTKPFLKWAGGKRWIVDREEFTIPSFEGRYIEPFLGGGAVFFHHKPSKSIISDANKRLIETYSAIKDDWQMVWRYVKAYQRLHSRDFYYYERSKTRDKPYARAAQFIYLNRACWNGLYRVNLSGRFNVPIGTKTTIVFDTDNFEEISDALQSADIYSCDFAVTIDKARRGDFLFVDPPYTTAHNFNGFVKYNQKIFSWEDQVRLRDSLAKAAARGARVALTNAAHESISGLYEDLCGDG